MKGRWKDEGENVADKHAHTHIRHHHRHMAQHITAHQYHATNLHRRWFPQPKHPPLQKIHLPLYFCLCVHLFILPTHIPSNLIPEARASFPGEEVNVTKLPLHRHCCCCCCCRSPLCTLFHRNIQKDKSKQAEFCSPSSNQTIHGSSSCLWASASSQLASSFRQAASRQLPFFFKAPQAEQIRGPAQLRG